MKNLRFQNLEINVLFTSVRKIQGLVIVSIDIVIKLRMDIAT